MCDRWTDVSRETTAARSTTTTGNADPSENLRRPIRQRVMHEFNVVALVREESLP
jgi:hypothetical protein